MPLAIGGVVAGVSGLGKIITGIGQNSEANKLKRSLVRPTYNIQNQYYTNQNLAEQQAEGGLSEASKAYYGGQSDRGLTAGINATLQGGGNVNNIGGLYDKYNQGNLAIAAKDSELQNQNINNLIERNKDLASEETKAWALNKYEPYKDQAQAASAEKNAAQQNIFGGIGELGSAATAFFQPKYEDSASGSRQPQIQNPPVPPTIAPGPTTALPQNPFSASNIVPGSDLDTVPMVNRNPFNSTNTIIPGSALDTSSDAGFYDTLNKYKNSPYYNSLQSIFNRPK